MTMTERLAELDAALARFPVSLPWYSVPTPRDGVTGIHGEPHPVGDMLAVAYLADVFGDAEPVVAAMNMIPDLRAHIDAQAATIAECEANINLKADFIKATINQLAQADATIARLRKALDEAQGWFAEYAVMHLDKNTPEGVAKAASNAHKAEYCAAALNAPGAA